MYKWSRSQGWFDQLQAALRQGREAARVPQDLTKKKGLRTMTLTRWSVCSLALVLASAAFAQSQQRQQALKPAAATSGTDCFATFTSGSGATAFTFCVTSNGNILQLEAPAGVEHIRNGVFLEGFTICDHTFGRRYWDLGQYVPNGDFGAPTIVQPNGPNTLPLSITRTTFDFAFTLKQTYARNNNERSVTVTMSLTSAPTGFTTPVSVSLWRAADFDMNGNFENWGGATQDSAFAWNNVNASSPIGNGGILTSLSLATPHSAGVTVFGQGDPACPDFRDVGWPRIDDVVAYVGHDFVFTANSQTKTVSVKLAVF
jgi:uncharacterized protein YraI